MIRTSDNIADFAAALAKAQAELENVGKDATNPAYRSRYATLAGVLSEVRPKLAKHGISILQAPVNGDGTSIGIVTRLMHSSGQWIEGEFYVSPTKADAQGAGSAITYARRYCLMAVAGVGPADDDDGEAAVGRPKQNGNGHVERPGTRARQQMWSGKEPAPLPAPEPPHDPETGEVTPHKIAVRKAAGTDLPNWLKFGQELIAAIKSSRTKDEWARWQSINGAAMAAMQEAAPAQYKHVEAAILDTVTRLDVASEPMTAAEMA